MCMLPSTLQTLTLIQITWGILWTCRFWLGSSGVKPEMLHFQQTPGIVVAAGCDPHVGERGVSDLKRVWKLWNTDSGKHSRVSIWDPRGQWKNSGVHISCVSRPNSPKFSGLKERPLIISHGSVRFCEVQLTWANGARGWRLDSIGITGKPVLRPLSHPQKG